MMKESIKIRIIVFLLGAYGYGLVELLWRGRTHWSMALAGGICFTVIAAVQSKLGAIRLLYRCIICSVFITITELVFGLVFNVILNMKVWDYSSIKFNLGGQICLLFSVMWGFLSVVMLPFSKKIIFALQKNNNLV